MTGAEAAAWIIDFLNGIGPVGTLIRWGALFTGGSLLLLLFFQLGLALYAGTKVLQDMRRWG